MLHILIPDRNVFKMTYKAGVIGLGGHGFRHCTAYGRADGVEVHAVADVSEKALKRAEEEVSHARRFEDWRTMLAETDLDVLSVVTNGPSHAEIVLTAVEAGVPRIFCEKPFATSVGDARKMVEACEAKGVRLAVSHGRRWAKAYIELRKLIADGAIGSLCHFFGVFGGGMYACNGSHALDMMCMLSGSRPTSVTGYVDPSGKPNPRGAHFRDPGCLVHLQFESGMRATLDCLEDIGIPMHIDIIGSMGRITIRELEQVCEIIARSDADQQEPIGTYWLPLEPVAFDPEPVDVFNMLEAAIVELIGEGPISCGGAEGIQSMEMLMATHISHDEGHRPVSLPLDPTYFALDIPFT
jgi:predicted dehydrogenase